MTEDSAKPLLVLAAGQRCGSTLLQRLLSSHPDVLIWGEHAGQLRPVLAAAARMGVWSDTDGMQAREEFRRGGHQSFMANLTPERDRIEDAVRQFVRVLFAEPAAAAGRPIWGLKEVRYGMPEARALHRLFPDLAVIHIVRDPRDVLRSLDVWERTNGEWRRRDTEAAIADWCRVAESFLHSDLDGMPPVLPLRYEEIVDDPAEARDRIAKHTGLDPARLDLGVFDRRIHTDGPNGEQPRSIADWSSLSPSLRALLDRDDIRVVASACGYDL